MVNFVTVIGKVGKLNHNLRLNLEDSFKLTCQRVSFGRNSVSNREMIR